MPYDKKEYLEAKFKQDQRPSREDMNEFASHLDIDPEKIFLWFRHKRYNFKNQLNKVL